MDESRIDGMRNRAILVVAGAVGFATAPFFAPFGGFDPALFPVPQADPPAQPAGYAFAIWGVIYLWLLGHAIFGLVRRAEDPLWDAPRWPLILTLVAGTPWTAVAGFSPIWATLLIFVMLGGALRALHTTPVAVDRWLLRAPVALLAGWLTAASFAGLAILGAGYGIGPGATGWAVIALLAATALAIAVQRSLGGTPEYAIAVIWALVAIVVRNAGVSWSLAALAFLAALAVAATWYRCAR